MLEIAVQDPAGARTAHAGGADRVEVCSALVTGGLTPSLAIIEASVATGIDAVVLIRPRPGDFELSDEEIEVCTRDIMLALQSGARGVVIGALREGSLNADAIRTWRDAALTVTPDAQIVVHRCVDVLLGEGLQPERLLDQLANIGGITRILTSGGAPSCREGIDTLAALAAGSDIEILAGGGLRPEDIPALASRGISQFHLSARRSRTGGPSGPGGGAASYDVTDEELVRAAVSRAALN